ncbi:MAG: anthranilate phosphoribosyltransferase [Terriglobales bacterium]
MREQLQKLLAREDLTRAEARTLLQAILTGPECEAEQGAHGIRVAAILTALAAKGETAEEMAGFAEAMRAAMVDIGLDGHPRRWVDTCGTGGNARKVFNVSTAAALAAAGAGVPVAKHGNRTSTSVCGSADVLEAMGVRLDFPAARLGACLEQVGIAFLFAPQLHPATRQVMPVRRALGVRTIFNALGPLTNPAGARAQVVGVASEALLTRMAEALQLLGTEHSFVVRSRDGIGEFSTTDVNDVIEIRKGQAHRFMMDARELGLSRADFSTLHCERKEDAVEKMHSVLRGDKGELQDIVSLNAAAAMVAGGLAGDFREGIERARSSLESGAAKRKLDELIAYTNR